MALISQVISDSDFMLNLRRIMSEHIQRTTVLDSKGHVKIQNGKTIYKIDEKDEIRDGYCVDVFRKAALIVTAYNQLSYIQTFISRFSDKEYYKKKNINRPIYIKYHYENHFIKVSKIFDLMMILVANTYRLGLPPSRISLSILRENSFTKNTKSVKLLIDMEKKIQDIKSMRNKIVHHDELEDERIDRFNMYFYLNETEEGPKKLFDQPLLDKVMKFIAKEKKQDLINKNKIVLDYILKLFQSLVSDFNKTEKQLRNTFDKNIR